MNENVIYAIKRTLVMNIITFSNAHHVMYQETNISEKYRKRVNCVKFD